MPSEITTVMVTAVGYDCIDVRAVNNEAATNKSTEDARIFIAEPDKAIRPVPLAAAVPTVPSLGFP